MTMINYNYRISLSCVEGVETHWRRDGAIQFLGCYVAIHRRTGSVHESPELVTARRFVRRHTRVNGYGEPDVTNRVVQQWTAGSADAGTPRGRH